MTTEIYAQTHGRTIATYDLLDDIQEAHNLSRQDAHNAIHAMLDDLIAADGEGIILHRRPARPELDAYNPSDLDRDHWLVISDETAQEIRDALAATYA
ncbi:hypothetical protein [Streptomyces sp. CC228A]|uniref:hypothetical protein n=1 Tax=Streptomyces sp. CC228A TaxID=2898186 RepID=UPI001F47BD4E|nr:hypothetical protein [Streptomyces sp. CC228A]